MKPTLSAIQWVVVFERLSGATQRLAELAGSLDSCDETQTACDEAKRMEMDLCVLDSRLRQLRKESEPHKRVGA